MTLAGLLAWRARRDGALGPLLALAGSAWLISACGAPAGSTAIVFTAALVLAHAAPPLIAHAGLLPADGPSRALAGAGYVACIGVAGLGAAVLFDPVAEGCGDCSRNLVLMAEDADAQLAVARWGLAFGAGVLAIAALVLVARLVRAGAARRVRNGPVLAAVIAFIGLAAAQLAHGVDRGFVSNDVVDRRLWTAQTVAMLLIAAATAWEPLRRRRTRAQLARLVIELLAKLRDDPATHDAMVAIESARAGRSPHSIACPTRSDSRATLEGVFETTLRKSEPGSEALDDWEELGVTSEHLTLELSDGRAVITIDGPDGPLTGFDEPYTVYRDVIKFGGTGGPSFSARWKLDGKRLRFSEGSEVDPAGEFVWNRTWIRTG